MTKRTDPHRVGAIVPEDYTYVLSYALATTEGGWPIPAMGINCEIDRRTVEHDARGKVVKVTNGEHDADGRCCWLGLRAKGVAEATHGSPGQCTVCGARFKNGDVWVHNPTGEHIHVGHDCAAKYSLLAERGDFDAALDARSRRAAGHRIEEQSRAAVLSFCELHQGLFDDLAVEHPIIHDIAEKLRRFHSISDKQVALVRKLAAEVRNPAAAERHVAAPEGRTTVRGKVVAVKSYDGQWGPSYKMTVKVTTPDGAWLAWGTAPDAIISAGSIKGAEVEFTAQLSRGNEPHFAIFKRPTKARVIELAAVAA